MPTIVTQHEDTHLISHYPKKEMVAEYSKPGTPNVIPEESKALRIDCDAILDRLNLSEKSIT
jgi:hypothetical protein